MLLILDLTFIDAKRLGYSEIMLQIFINAVVSNIIFEQQFIIRESG